MLQIDEKVADARIQKKRLNQFQAKSRGKKEPKKEKSEKEGKVAYFCLHASRLFIQISTFMQESLHVTKAMQSQRKLCVPTQFPEEPEREQFLFQGEDLF